MASFHKPKFIMSLQSKSIGFQLLLKTVHHLVSSVILVHPLASWWTWLSCMGG